MYSVDPWGNFATSSLEDHDEHQINSPVDAIHIKFNIENIFIGKRVEHLTRNVEIPVEQLLPLGGDAACSKDFHAQDDRYSSIENRIVDDERGLG